MIQSFEKSFKVGKNQLEEYIGYPVKNFDKEDMANLKGVYDALKDGVAKREDYFSFKGTDFLQPDGSGNRKEDDADADG